MNEVLNISNVSHSFSVDKNSIPILKNINLNIPIGEFVSIIGKSGSGKSTLLNLISGYMKPKSGMINIFGTDITKLDESKMALFRQKNIGFIFQSYNLIPTMTVLENVELPLELSGEKKKSREPKALEVLKLMGLEHRKNHYPGELSGGEQQRVGIGRAIIRKPKIILADEPTGNLDSETGVQIMDCLKMINTMMKSILIVVTHDIDIANSAHRVVHIKDGRIEG